MGVLGGIGCVLIEWFLFWFARFCHDEKARKLGWVAVGIECGPVWMSTKVDTALSIVA